MMNTTKINADLDVVIIGAGVSGIGLASHLTRDCPHKKYLILERRESIGGTWDLFRYPGVRSDSDMSTFGFNFKPWVEDSMLAQGEQIRNYLVETAEEYQVTDHIRFGTKVTDNKWCSKRQLWTIYYKDEKTGSIGHVTARFMISCTGYYNYDQAYTPDFKGKNDFQGDIIHPQFWPKNYDYTGKKVVVIGSGATAVTLVPSMVDTVEKITMLQRSPTYVYAMPAKDVISAKLRGKVSDLNIYRFSRVRNVAMQLSTFKLAKKYPKITSKLLKYEVKKNLDSNFDMKHFSPNYKPWDQRLCVVPDGDLFQALKTGKAQVVTDHIDYFTKTGIQLQSGQHLDADIIITATGLSLQLSGGSNYYIDDKPIALKTKMTYKGVLMQDVPNAAIIFGYINSSWTLKVDIAANYICRLINYMDKKGYTEVTAKDNDDNITTETLFEQMNSGYIQRANHMSFRQGKSSPWKVTNNLLADVVLLRFGKINQDVLLFKKPTHQKKSLFNKTYSLVSHVIKK